MIYKANNRKGFTLIEILVVLALTILILGLVFYPVIESFGFTRRAETMVRAQDNARFALEQVSRELADAMFVYDNTNQPIDFPVTDGNGNPVTVKVLYAKVDIVLPRMMGFCTSSTHPAGAQKEFPRHDPLFPELDEAHPSCPIAGCGAPLELRPAQPLAADKFIVRYFIGLADPSKPYANGYTTKFSEGADNMFVLYRAEFSPYDRKLFDDPTTAAFQDNLRDPSFFYGPHSAQWRKISRPVVTIPHTDLIVREFSGVTPVITPTVKFTPTAIYNDPLVPTTESDDDPEHGEALPTVYKASYGQWTTPIEVTLTREGQNNQKISYRAVQAAATPPNPPTDCMLLLPNGDSLFNISNYLRTKALSPYRAGQIGPVDKPEVAFTIDFNKGMVDFAFPVVDVSASSNLPSTIGKMAVSKTVSTDDINNAYVPGGAVSQDRYRSLIVNEPGFLPTPIGNFPTVVAGSERIVAPDAAPGANWGKPLRYSRVPSYLYEPGLNQYQLDTEYNDGTTTSPLGLACLFFHSYQTNQPGSGVALPPGVSNLHVYYEVQNNKKGDTLRANYVTKSLLTVVMGIRIYDPTSGKPQSVQLTNKVKLRNVAQ